MYDIPMTHDHVVVFGVSPPLRRRRQLRLQRPRHHPVPTALRRLFGDSAPPPAAAHPPVFDNGSDAGSDADIDPVGVGVIGDDLDRAVAAVCTMVGCRRQSRLTAQFVDENGNTTTDTICCEPCVTGDGHSAACAAASAAASD